MNSFALPCRFLLLVFVLLASLAFARSISGHDPGHHPRIQGFIATLYASPSSSSSFSSSSRSKRGQFNVRTAALRDPRFRFALCCSSSSSSTSSSSSPSDSTPSTKDVALERLVSSLLSLRGGGAQQAAAAAAAVLGPTTVRSGSSSPPHPSPDGTPLPKHSSLMMDSEEGEGDVGREGGRQEFGNTLPRISFGLWPVGRNASLWSAVSFGWVDPLMARGNAQPLEMEDLWHVAEEDKMSKLSQEFQAVYAAEAEKADGRGVLPAVHKEERESPRTTWAQAPLIRTFLRLFRLPLLTTGALRLAVSCVQFLPPLLIARLLRLLEAGAGLDVRSGYRLVLCLAVTLIAKTGVENQYYHHLSVMGLQASTVGEIVNMMQLDAARLEGVASSVHTLWNGLLDIVVYMAMLVACMGPSMLAGILIMASVIPLNAVFLGILAKARERTLKSTDSRVKLTNEVLQGIRSIKSYAWETPFLKQVEAVRAQELSTIMSAAKLRGVLVAFLGATPSIVSMVTLWAYVALGNTLSASKVFTALALFNQLRFPLLYYPMVIAAFAEGRVALTRLQNFLDAPQVEGQRLAEPSPASMTASLLTHGKVATTLAGADSGAERGQGEGVGIHLHDASFSYAVQANRPAPGAQADSDDATRLRNCSLSVVPGEVVAVVGSLGSGKSSLVRALLGEMSLLKGDAGAEGGREGGAPPHALHALTHDDDRHVEEGGRETRREGEGPGGVVRVEGSLAYVPQTAWVPNEAFRDCVLFGSPYNAVKYQRTLDACCLGPDVARLEASDQTEIGERGVTLSGGQKQRLALARAVYADADIYLLDDPFSALDAQVGRQVFENCLRDPKGPLAGKAVVLVTNQLQFLPYVDKIVMMGPMEGGNGDVGIIDQGRYWDLIARGHDLESMLASSATAAAAASPSPSHDETERQGEHGHHADIGVAAAAAGGASGVGDEQHASYHQLHASDEEGMEGEPLLAMEEQGVGEEVREEGLERGKLMKEEERITGAVKAKVYNAYLGAVRSPLLILLAVISFVVANGTQFIQQAIIAAWTSDPLHIKRPARVYLLGVSSMAAMVAAFNYLRTYLSVLAGVRASDYLHHRALQKVLGAPMRYFDTTPLGSLVQRFSSDLDQVDQQLPGTLGMFITCVFQLVGTLGAILAATPQFSVALFPISWIYLSVMNYFRAVTRELKRLDSLSRSPIYSHFSETLGGLSVIRAFRKEKAFIKANEAKVDDNVRAYISLKAADRWLSVRLELLGAGVVGIGAVLSVHGTAMGHLGAGLAGLALTNALGVTGLLNWAVRCLAETEAIMNSVERVQQLVESVPAEAPAHLNALSHAHDLSALDALHRNISSGGTTGAGMVTRPVRDLQDDASLVASGWPWKGGLYFRRAVMRYRQDTSPILQGFTAAIRPKEKIGIVGRTGAGKSSLFVGLLRLVELEGGSIEIDGVDISKVGLATLRSAVSVIPQDPVLFSGSIRSNLDPFQTYDDATLWSALRKASLEGAFRTSPLGLDQPVSEYGENLSSGQRQLLCLARALLRKPRILLLDEATSSVDQATDQLIQETIRREFLDCTVLTIAHRLETVLDSDRILVMQNGRLVEFDRPQTLLGRRNSLFAALVRGAELEGGAEVGQGGSVSAPVSTSPLPTAIPTPAAA
ncbi:hypothetical protein NSK_006792 [Nannochloropsis salina CCMP1776]|uniref:Uncharacterized protein n=1 Tax=Nannochloropsis salina CCMP1776 TaxID=1027361 RepID=A0A4D9CQY4_9STRA|nr:hypothetical protein NSK_006792 [Nannochloropsis salina CCMP1776]|eukprot:TFJ81540.1 hypothetical protein NSK_006792 [Nannochloropsis salina CCMP1776]